MFSMKFIRWSSKDWGGAIGQLYCKDFGRVMCVKVWCGEGECRTEWFDMNRLIFVWSLIYVLQVLLELTLGIEYYRGYRILSRIYESKQGLVK